MRFIVVDTADSRGSVALFEGNRPLNSEVHAAEEDYSSWLLPAVHRLLAPHRLSLSQLDGYAVCAGPGSFTGLRVGLTTVKAWSEIYSQPIVALSRLEALLETGPGEAIAAEPFVATYFDGRRNQLFAALYRQSKGRFTISGEEAVTAAADFIERVAAESAGLSVCWRTPDPELIQLQPAWERLLERGHTIQIVEPPFAARLGSLALRKFQNGDTTDSLSLDANYVRRSDAEVLWKGNASPLEPQKVYGC